MGSQPKKIILKGDIEAVDIPTMVEMTDQKYREYVHNDGLVFVDHHNVLRSSAAAYPLATTLEQFDILMDELQKLRSKMMSR